MRHPFRTTIAALAVVSGASTVFAGTVFAGPANAQTSGAGLNDVKTKAAAAITARLNSLNSAIIAVDNNKWLTTTDKSTSLQILNSDVPALTTLGAKIQADTTLSQVTADYKTIFTGYRVYLLVLPQIRLAAVGDDLGTGVVPKLTDAQTRLENLLNGRDKGKDNPTIQAAMADLNTQIQAITQETDGLSATVLAYTPAQYDANTSILSPAHTAIKTARADAKTARQDIQTVVEALK